MSLKPAQAQAESDGRAIVSALVERSNRLGADPRNTNYAGGNTSAKGWAIDPVTGEPVELLWVKGSGGDLGTLTERGLAVLRLDRLRSLVEVYPGVEREDEMVGALDYCLFGPGGAAPSIDTAMHGLIDADHVDHLHPDSGIAFATAADGPELTRRCFGDRVAWVDWRRPGLRARPRSRRDPAGPARGDRGDPRRPRDHGLGRHVRGVRGAIARDHPHGGDVHRGARPSRSVRAGRRRVRPAHRDRATRPGGGAVPADPRARLDGPPAGRPLRRQRHASSTSWPGPSTRGSPRWARRARTTSCGPRSGRWSSTCRRPRSSRRSGRGSASSTRPIASTYRRYYERYATAGQPAMRGADPAIVLVPGIGMFSFGADVRTARVAGEFYVNAINVMRGAEAPLDLRADPGGREVPDRVLGARGGEARPPAEAEAARDEGRRRHRRRVGDRQGDRPSAGGRGRLRRGRRHRRGDPRRPSPRSSAGRTRRSASSPT